MPALRSKHTSTGWDCLGWQLLCEKTLGSWDEPTSAQGSLGGSSMSRGSSHCNQLSWMWVLVLNSTDTASYSNSISLVYSSIEWKYHSSVILRCTFCPPPPTHMCKLFLKLTWLLHFLSAFSRRGFSLSIFSEKLKINWWRVLPLIVS